MTLPIALLALALCLAPLFAATPDEPLWSSLVCAIILLTAVLFLREAGRRQDQSPLPPMARHTLTAFVILLALALLSMPVRLLMQHGIGFVGPMLRAWAILATQFALFAVGIYLARSGRAPLYAIAPTMVGVGTIIAAMGLQEYLVAVRDIGDIYHRVFATSTPDYLAAYLVVLLPVTLALCLCAPPANFISPLFGLAFLVQLATLLLSQSRFALVSLAVSAVVFAAGVFRARRGGLTLTQPFRRRLAIIAVLLLLPSAFLIKPVLNRLQNTPANSGDFRKYTWAGSAQMAARNPLLGTGMGTYVFLYPRYAVTGFTRVAHNSYLQLADDCGIPALLAFLAVLGFSGAALWRGLSAPVQVVSAVVAPPARKSGKGRQSRAAKPAPKTHSILDALAPEDDRVLLCGLMAGLAAGAAQNFIDSDWHIFFFGITYWAVAGIGVGLASRGVVPDVLPPRRPVLAIASVAAGLTGVFMVAQTVGAAYVKNAQAAAHDPLPGATAQAEDAYQNALRWDPGDSGPRSSTSDLGYSVYLVREQNVSAAEEALRHAISLRPEGLNYARLATVYGLENRHEDAVAAYKQGLITDPHSVDLLLDLARISPPDQARDAYQKIVQIEDSPVGTVLALGDLTNAKYADAQAWLGDDALAKHNISEAGGHYRRAANTLEAYARGGGSANPMRSSARGGLPDSQADADRARLYQHVMDQWIGIAPADQRAVLQQDRVKWEKAFADFVGVETQSGNRQRTF